MPRDDGVSDEARTDAAREAKKLAMRLTRTDPVEAVEKARESIILADAEMRPGSARMGHALAHLANAIQALADGLETVDARTAAGTREAANG